MRRLWRDYNLGIVLFALFFASWVAQTWAGWVEFAAEQRGQGEAASVFGGGGYVWNWAQATFENWQSEFLQLFAMVTLTSMLVFRRSPESKDGQEELQRTIERVERRLEELAAAPSRDAAMPVAAD